MILPPLVFLAASMAGAYQSGTPFGVGSKWMHVTIEVHVLDIYA
jgi:hypothetical protein